MLLSHTCLVAGDPVAWLFPLPLLHIPLFFQVTYIHVTSSSPNSPCISAKVSSSSSSSHCIIAGVSVVPACWVSPSCGGMYRRRRRACIVPFSSVPSSRQSVYELSSQSVIILGGDQQGNSLAFVSYVTSSFELYICIKSPSLNSMGCTLSSKIAFLHAASARAPV